MTRIAPAQINFSDNHRRKTVVFVCALVIFICTVANVSAQSVAIPPRPPLPRISRNARNKSEIPAEKFIATDAKVNISLCVTRGGVKINGWERDETRVFVAGGGDAGFSVRDKNEQTGKPNLLNVLGFDPAKNKQGNAEECLSGDEIELDVPHGATVNLTSYESNIEISAISKVKIENDGGNIYLNDIARGIDAKTYQGNLIVEKSRGAMTLSSANGNIIVFETAGVEVGDGLRAKTISGGIILQQAAQKQIEASSNTGSLKFDGAFTSGGQYSFATTSGTINLLLPADSSFKIEAFYGGVLQSEFPLKAINQDVNSQAQKLIAVFGTGAADLSLKNLSGAIRIKKK